MICGHGIVLTKFYEEFCFRLFAVFIHLLSEPLNFTHFNIRSLKIVSLIVDRVCILHLILIIFYSQHNKHVLTFSYTVKGSS